MMMCGRVVAVKIHSTSHCHVWSSKKKKKIHISSPLKATLIIFCNFSSFCFPFLKKKNALDSQYQAKCCSSNMSSVTTKCPREEACWENVEARIIIIIIIRIRTIKSRKQSGSVILSLFFRLFHHTLKLAKKTKTKQKRFCRVKRTRIKAGLDGQF